MTDEPPQFADTNPRLSGAPSEEVSPTESATLMDDRDAERQADSLSVGDHVAQYHVLKRLGAGAMGTVVEAYDKTLDRRVALKVLHDAGSKKNETRLLREAQALARLSHPNVVQVYEVGQSGDRLFIAMELVVGQTLGKWERQDRSWREIIEAYSQAGQGLASAHAQGLIHRDFKPSNCIVKDNGRVKVLDFGLARESGDSDSPSLSPTDYATFLSQFAEAEGSSDSNHALRQALTRTGAVLGTPAYMAPEQLRGGGLNTQSDQFNFCVALYEALYKTRPFPHDSLGELINAVMGGDLRTPPQNSGVPKGFWPIIRRGLAVDPAKRWPSMESLLQGLHQVANRKGAHRWIVAAALVTTTTVGVAWMQSREAAPCSDAAERLATVWTPQRSEKIRDAILATGLPYAGNTADRVERELDDYAEAWATQRTEACQATRVRGEQSVQMLELRMHCFEQQRIALSQTVELLEDADAAMVENAVSMAARLPALDRCDDVQTLASSLAPPEDPQVAQEVESLRETMSQARALVGGHRNDEAFTTIDPVVQRALALGYRPLIVEAQLERGIAHKLSGRFEEAQTDLIAAFDLALEIGHNEVAATASQELTYVVGSELAQRGAGRAWGVVAEATARRVAPDSTLHANALRSVAIVLITGGDVPAATERFEQALRIAESRPGPPSIELSRALGDMGNLSMSTGKFDIARDYYTRSMEIRRAILGAGHPSLAHGEINLGRVEETTGNLDKAEQHYANALAVWKDAANENHPDVAIALNNLAVVYDKQGKPEQALTQHKRALAIRETSLGPEHPYVAHSHVNIGLALRAMGDNEGSLPHFIRAYALAETMGSRDLEHTLFELSEAEFLLGKLEGARAKRERHLTLTRSHEDENSSTLGFSEFGLAQVQWAQGEHAAARALATQALTRVEAAGPAGESLRLTIVDWLADHVTD